MSKIFSFGYEIKSGNLSFLFENNLKRKYVKKKNSVRNIYL